MALGFVDAIGLIGTGLGIIQFGLDNFVPDQQEAKGTIVGIKSGEGQGASDTLGGEITKVYAYSSKNEQLGTADGQTMAGNGDYLTFTVDQDVPGTQGQYIGIQNGDDATCIAWITVKMYDNSIDGAWTGDIGRFCGQTWFESQEVAGQLDDGTLYRPSCTWLDANHDNDIISASLKFATNAYGSETSQITLDQDACASTVFAVDEGEITDAPADPSLPKRETLLPRARLPWMEKKLIISDIASHSAVNLCNSQTSWGPDFVSSTEGKLCDMATKTLYTLCSKEQVDGCVKIDTEPTDGASQTASVASQRLSVAKRTVKGILKSYEQTAVWAGDD
ncbi:hypothetical protein QM012_006992 [Aureobasidium pullulans]|uniref:Uncharacterized protein n=1 Tax=Aureobasidium pullulans TaxID=5580 RepID=A0ABR0TQI2_AURPU